MNKRIQNKLAKARIMANVRHGIKTHGLDQMEEETAKFGPIDYGWMQSAALPVRRTEGFNGRFA